MNGAGDGRLFLALVNKDFSQWQVTTSQKKSA